MNKQSLFFRSTAIFLLLNFLNYTFFPLWSYALTAGPHQPEYTSYEEPGATDLVNLLTGDFTFNLPVMEVPGPEGGFSVPLSYHAGVGLDQASSWVGLGFSLNVGAIARNVVEYPDDAKGEFHQIHRRNDDLARGWNGRIPGIGTIGWDSNKGHLGTISVLGLVGASYKNGSLTGGNIMGAHFNSQGVTANPLEVASAVMTVASFGAAGSAAVAQAAKKGISASAAYWGAVAKQAAIGVATEAVMTGVAGVPVPGSNIGGYWELSQRTQKGLFHTNYWIWLDKTRYENMYGVLYLGDMKPTHKVKSEMGIKVYGASYNGSNPKIDAPVYAAPETFNDIGATSDMHYAWNGETYGNTFNPSSLAKDYYSVMGAGISGSIEPYRLDVGSLSMPREMSLDHIRIALAPFKNNTTASVGAGNYKVQFQYRGAPSNSYFFHAGSDGSRDENGRLKLLLDNPNYGIGHGVAHPYPQNNYEVSFYTYQDPTLPEYYSPTDPGSMAKVEDPRYGLSGYKLVKGKHIEWYSNQELINGVPGFIDYLSKEERENQATKVKVSVTQDGGKLIVGRGNIRYFKVGDIVSYQGTMNTCSGYFSSFRISAAKVTVVGADYIEVDQYPPCTILNAEINLENVPAAKNVIGGYSITKEDGTQYFYSLPVYEWGNETSIENIADPDNITKISRAEAFPSTWLLTAVVGPDYLDRNGNGQPDEGDWGRWVKFTYGKFSENYAWRTPYSGYRKTENGESKVYSSGVREQYYLNSIHTRTHTALFIKDLRKDGRAVYRLENNAVNGGSSLKLNEIVLLANEDFNALQTSYGLSESTSNDADYLLLSANDSFEKVYDEKDFSTEARNYLNQKAQKRVLLNYSYDLCKNTPNSFEVNSSGQIIDESLGKLTLNSISMYGANSMKIAPDFKFAYGYNPSYLADRWDGWGYYTMSGGTSHQASPNEIDGTAWSLTKIISPMGNTIEVEYERDRYSSIAHYGYFTKDYSFNDTNWSDGISLTNAYEFSVGDKVKVVERVLYDCNGTVTSIPIEVVAIVTEKGSSYIKIDQPRPIQGCLEKSSNGGTVTRFLDKRGGDVRVAAIKATDGNGSTFKTRYIYTTDGKAYGPSTGVVAREPEYIKTQDYDFYELFDFPSTPVMYGKVMVLSGKLTTDEDYISRQVYEFETPHYEMVKVKNTSFFNREQRIRQGYQYNADGEPMGMVYEHLQKELFVVDVNTAKIGQLQAVTTYDKEGKVVATTRMQYSDAIVSDDSYPHQGVFTEGSILAERVLDREKSDSKNFYAHYRMFRTTKRYNPSVLTKVVTTKDGFTATQENKVWDFITGAVLKELHTNPQGIRTLSETVPAYHVYPEMGPKAENVQNKHMLGQVAASYAYRLDSAGNKNGLLGASVQSWKKDWNNYRELSNGAYADANADNHQVWRKHQSYTYQGNLAARQNDGSLSFTEANKFNFTSGAANTGWKYLGEVTRYDHYSMPLESKDFTGIYAATKLGYQNKAKIAEASNARYEEMAFSGAEDEDVLTGYFGGEVHRGNGMVVKKASGAAVHTGDASLQLTSGNGFVYKTDKLRTNKTYRASVWTNSLNGRIYYKLNGGAEQLASPTASLKAGGWYQINVHIPVGATFSSLEIGVKTAAGTVNFDDFRFQPVESGMAAYVYNSQGALAFTLDNDNLYTEYEYDDTGRLIRTYRESMRYGGTSGRLLVSESDYNYGRYVQDKNVVRDKINFTTPSNPEVDVPLAFRVTNADSNYGPYKFEWSFGDGSSATTTDPWVAHTYTSSGYKNVELTILVEEDGYRRSITKRINVSFKESCKPRGTFISERCEIEPSTNCNTGNLIKTYADGNCGTYTEKVFDREACPFKSSDCIGRE